MVDSFKHVADLFIPDHVLSSEAYARCSHLAIGAHPDDLEFMAFHGIQICYDDDLHWFGGVTCTDGSSSPRAGKYAAYTDEQMKVVRMHEQRTAAEIGQYSFIQQLGLTSSMLHTPASRATLVDALASILVQTQPEVVYTHNPADKHPTHITVCLAALEAIRRVPLHSRPNNVYGCEVWGALDWLSAEDKIALDVSCQPELAEKLNACFDSQITGGKNYSAAVMGRRRANATFFDSHRIDCIDQLWFAMDLTSLIEDSDLNVHDFVQAKIKRFEAGVLEPLQDSSDREQSTTI